MKLNNEKIVGSWFCAGAVAFLVLGIEPYPAARVSARYKEILSIQSGMLVAVDYRGTCIPNITVNGGVVRLTKVLINGKTIQRPGAISKALGITRPMCAYSLTNPD